MCIPAVLPIPGMGGGGGGGSKSSPPAIAAPKPPPQTAAFAESQGESQRARRRRGLRSTILTGPEGLEEPANVRRKTVLGA